MVAVPFRERSGKVGKGFCFFKRWVYIRNAYTLMLKNKIYNVIHLVSIIIIVVVIIISSSTGGGA